LFGRFFQIFVFNFGARSTQLRCFFQDTPPSAAFHVVIRSSCRKHRLRRCSRPCFAFFGLARCWMGSTMVDLQLGGTVDDACPSRAAVSSGIRCCLYCRQPVFWIFSALCFVFSLFSRVQSACVLLKFYWNFCWLDARSALFYLKVSVNVRDAQM
jgi:hypothetical protein